MLQKLFLDQGDAKRIARDASELLEKGDAPFNPRKMPKSTRSVAIELHENATAIEAWRVTLPERHRKRRIRPLSNVRRWRASLDHGNGKCPQDLKRDAAAAWQRFVSCVEALPPGSGDDDVGRRVGRGRRTSHRARAYTRTRGYRCGYGGAARIKSWQFKQLTDDCGDG
jgi:hypothetical protein